MPISMDKQGIFTVFFKEAFPGFQIEGFCWVIVLSG
jgi:hypothetical protein